MKNFNSERGGERRGGGFRGNDRGGDRGGFQKKSWSSDRPQQMHKAVCAECGKTCEVPFRPTGDKPIYCNDCFAKMRGDESRPSRDYGERFAPRPDTRSDRPRFSSSSDTTKALADISMKLDRLISAIEKMQTPKVEARPKASERGPIPELALFKEPKPKAKKAEAKSSPRPKAGKKVAKKK